MLIAGARIACSKQEAQRSASQKQMVSGGREGVGDPDPLSETPASASQKQMGSGGGEGWRTETPSARHSLARASPISLHSSGSHDAPMLTPAGKQVAGFDAPATEQKKQTVQADDARRLR